MNQNNHAGSNQRGAVIIMVAVSLIMIFGFAALAVDVTRHVVVGNEVQNAVDAGALAGARALYIINPDNTTTFTPAAAKAAAIAVAVANAAAGASVAVDNATVQRGHWTFDTPGYDGSLPLGFTPNPTLADYEFDEDDDDESLNVEEDWVNAVKVTAITAGPVRNFFARIFGSRFASFNTTKDAVAYIGFAGYFPPRGVDLPIAICADAFEENRCTVGRMYPATEETARWTDFTQAGTGGCDTASTAPGQDGSVYKLLEACDGNPSGVKSGKGVSTTNGTVGSSFQSLEDCFIVDRDNNTGRIMHVTLPVVDCEGEVGTPNCKLVTAFMEIDIVWVKTARDTSYDEAPEKIFDVDEDGLEDTADDDELYQIWPRDGFEFPGNATGEERWARFVDEDDGYNLQDDDGNPANYEIQKAIYFRANCEVTVPVGPPGGAFMGIISQIPVLVE